MSTSAGTFASEETYRLIIDAMAEGVVLQYAEGGIQAMNRSAEQILGRTLAQIAGASSQSLPWQLLSEEGSPLPVEMHPSVISFVTGQPCRDVVVGICRPDQSVRWVQVNTVPLVREKEARPYAVVSTFVDITERRVEQRQLRKIDRALRTLRKCDEALIHATDETELLDRMCRIIVDYAGYLRAWVGFVEHDADKTVRPAVMIGDMVGYTGPGTASWADNAYGQGAIGRAVRGGKPCAVQDVETDPGFQVWRSDGVSLAYRSILALPLNSQAEVFGVLVIHCAERQGFSEEEISLLAGLADDLAYGITVLRARKLQEQQAGALIESEQRWQFALDAGEQAVWDLFVAEGKAYYSPRWRAMLGYVEGDIKGTREEWTDLIHPDDLPGVMAGMQSHYSGAYPFFAHEFRMRCRNGGYLWVKSHGKVIARDAAGNPLRMIGTTIDISRAKAAERHQALAALVFESSHQAILVCDRDGIILTVNRAFTTMTGYSERESVGRTTDFLSSGQHDEEFFRQIHAELESRSHWEGEIWSRRGNGEVFPQFVTIDALRDSDGAITNYVRMAADISERKAQEERIQYLAQYDTLTDLPNRALLRDRISVALEAARRDGTRLALLFLDLDRFKNVNDSFGHEFGDKLLCEAAHRLASCIRASDTVSRLGGDEFVVMLPNLTSDLDAKDVARKLVESIARPYLINGREVILTLSVGISLFPQNGSGIDMLLRNADTALYAAKAAGRNQYRFYSDEMNARSAERLETENDLRHAIERNELFIEYQPQFDLDTGHVVGSEALVRWRHPRRGVVSPGEFIPIAEESGLIIAIGNWVMEQGCRQYARWIEAGLVVGQLAVNVSSHQFRHKDFVGNVLACLRNSRLDPARLELEVTESAIMHGSDMVLKRMRDLESIGVSLAIDDFGTGYSSLSYLKLFPLARLKVDQTFVRGLPRDSGDSAIVRAVVGMGHNMELNVLAEGIETPEQLAYLRSIGCHAGQGYLFSRPLPAKACEAFFRAREQRGPDFMQWDSQVRQFAKV